MNIILKPTQHPPYPPWFASEYMFALCLFANRYKEIWDKRQSSADSSREQEKGNGSVSKAFLGKKMSPFLSMKVFIFSMALINAIQFYPNDSHLSMCD